MSLEDVLIGYRSSDDSDYEPSSCSDTSSDDSYMYYDEKPPSKVSAKNKRSKEDAKPATAKKKEETHAKSATAKKKGEKDAKSAAAKKKGKTHANPQQRGEGGGGESLSAGPSR